MPVSLLQQLNRSQAGTSVEGQATASSPGQGMEGKLRGEVQLLKEQLKSAYEKAAEATSHIAQYQALAESSNQALEAMQASHCFLQTKGQNVSSCSLCLYTCSLSAVLCKTGPAGCMRDC